MNSYWSVLRRRFFGAPRTSFTVGVSTLQPAFWLRLQRIPGRERMQGLCPHPAQTGRTLTPFGRGRFLLFAYVGDHRGIVHVTGEKGIQRYGRIAATRRQATPQISHLCAHFPYIIHYLLTVHAI